MATQLPQPTSGQTLRDRFLGVFRLDWATYAAIKDDPAANRQAWVIVLLAGVVSGLGGAVARWQAWSRLQAGQGPIDPSTGQPLSIASVTLSSSTLVWLNLLLLVLLIGLTTISWLIVSALAGWIGKTVFGGDRSVTGQQMRRLIGWSRAPLLLDVFGAVPVLGQVVSLILVIWTIPAELRALRTGLNVSAGKAFGTWLVASLLPAVLFLLVRSAFPALAGLMLVR